MLTEHAFSTGTVTLNYAEGPPNGSPLMLLPGFTDRWQAYLPIIPPLLARWHVYTLDYRGHGKSSRAPGHYRADDYLADVRAFLLHQISQAAILLGLSAGGMLALYLAEELPEHVRGIIVGDASIDLDHHIEMMSTPDTQHFFAEWRELAGHPVEALIPVLAARGESVSTVESLSHVDPGVLAFHAEGRLQEFFEGGHRLDLQRIRCPVVLIQATPALGGMLSDEEVADALAMLPQAVHVRLAYNHNLGLFQGEEAAFLNAVGAFLESL